MQLRDPSIISYSDAVFMAKRLDWSSSGETSAPRPQITNPPANRSQGPQYSAPNQGYTRPSTTHSNQSTMSTAGSRPARRYRQMPQEKYRKHIAAGTCFRCGLHYTPSHRCPPKTLQVLIQDEEEEEEPSAKEPTNEADNPYDDPNEGTLQALRLSELSSHGIDGYQTM